MYTRKPVVLGVVALILAPLLLFSCSRSDTQEINSVTPEKIVVEQDTLYVYLDKEQMIDDADLIFLGKVVDISPTHWNQDSGEEWRGGLLIHTVAIEVLRPLVAGVDKSDVVTVTVLGESSLTGAADHDLAIGDQAVFFVRHTDLAWREGRSRPIQQLVSAPLDSYYRQRSDGLFSRPGESEPVTLRDITTEIGQRRAIVPDAEN